MICVQLRCGYPGNLSKSVCSQIRNPTEGSNYTVTMDRAQLRIEKLWLRATMKSG